MSECPNCAFGQMYAWGIFLCIYMLAWDAALTASVNRLQADMATARDYARSLRRPYLIALSAYSIVIAWLNVLFWVVLLFLACALACMTAPVATEYWEKIVRAFGHPQIVLHSVDLSHAGFHAIVIAASLMASSLSIGFYITDDDLIHQDTVNSKMLRVLFTAPAAMAAAYAFYILFCVVCTM